jgi:TP901 family phage tail tape measure protein
VADVNANIGVSIDTSQALAQLKNLQREISQFHTSITRSSATAAAAQRSLQTDFLNSINATGKFAAEFRTIKTASESFTNSLEKNKFSMGEYFRYAGGASKTFGKLFRTEFDTISKVAEDRVKKLQTQYIKMGRDASGSLKAMAVTPLALDMENLSTRTMIAAQKQQLFNELISKGTTNLVNFGKNTQWAGRQLMVGFTVPLTIFGSMASKTFMEIEAQALRFKRVYGDLFTTKTETQANLDAVRGLAQEFTKYGVAIKDTMSLAADAAAAGLTGAKLQEQVTQATRLSVLGEVDKQQAFQATISLQSAFQMSNKDLADSVNFLNAVENQSVTSLQDMTDAIPKVAPVIRGLGGDVKDMAVFLTAMKEGGVDAAESANGLKSALAAMINPSKAAKEMLKGVGINLQQITERNKGNLMRTVLELGDALKGLEPLARTQVLEKLFGKFQFARVSALFDNITRSGSQAQKTMELMSMSSTDLARIANKELTSIEENSAVKFKASVEALKSAIAPIGAVFISTVTPVLDFVKKIADKFSGLSDHTKKIIAVIITVIGGIAPVVLMLVGLFANLFGQVMKFVSMLRGGFSALSGGSKTLGEQTQYATEAQIEALAVASSLDQIHAKLTQKFTVEAEALSALRTSYLSASAAAETFALANPNMISRKRFATGGVVHGPGTGTSDSIPAMLSNGETVIPAKQSKRYGSLINGIIAGNIPGFAQGKGYKNATVFMPESMNTIMGQQGSAGIATGEVANYFKQAGGAAMAPLMAVMAKEMGMKINDSKFRGYWSQIGTQLSQTVVGALETSGQAMVTDENFESIVVPALKKTTAALNIEGKNLGAAFENAVEEIRTVGPVGGVSGSKGGGRTAFGSSYRYQRQAAQEFAMTENPDMFQRQPRFSKTRQMFVPSFRTFNTSNKEWEVGTMAHITKSITASAEDLMAKMKPYLGNVGVRLAKAIGMSAVDGMAQEAQVASPSKKARKVGQDTTKGAIIGMKDEVKNARAAGQLIGQTVASGAAHAGDGWTMGPARRAGMMSSAKSYLKNINPAGAMMGASGAVIGASMLPGAVGGFAQKLIPATMGLQALAMALPLLSNPAVAAGAALVAAVVGIKLFNDSAIRGAKTIEDAAKKQAEALYGSSSAINGFAAFIGGNALPSMQDYSRNNKALITADKAKLQTYSDYYSSKEGSRSNQIITSAAMRGQGSGIKASAADIAQRAAIFNLTPQDIAANIKAAGRLIGADEVKIKAKVQKLLAPNGKDITTEPLTIDARLNFLNSSSSKAVSSMGSQISNIGKLNLGNSGIFGLAGGRTYQELRRGAGEQQSMNQSFAGGFGGNVMGYLKGAASGKWLPHANDLKDFKKVQTEIQLATVQLDSAFKQQTESLGILNAEYEAGVITEQQYNDQFAIQMANFAALTIANKNLVEQLNKLDTTGKLAKAAVDDLVNNALAGLSKTNPTLFKQLKKDIDSLPQNMQVEIAMGYAQGGLTMIDIINLKKYMDMLSEKPFNAVIKLMLDDTSVSPQAIAEMELQKLKTQLESTTGPAASRIAAAIRKQQKIIDDAKKINPTPKPKPGTGTLDNSGTSTVAGSPFDAIVKQMRDLDFMNQKLTTGTKASVSALEKMFAGIGKGKGNKGLQDFLVGQKTSKPLMDLILGMSPEEWKANKDTLFTFNKDGSIKGITKDFTELNKVIPTLAIKDYNKTAAENIKTLQNQQTLVTKLTATGMSYADALDYIASLGPEVANALAGISIADPAWQTAIENAKKLKAQIESTPQGMHDAIVKHADTALKTLQDEAAAIQQANASKLKTDQDTIDALDKQIQSAQRATQGFQDSIDANNHSIDLLNHNMDITIDRPLAKLSEESDILSNNLAQIDHQAQSINDQYDKQAAALELVNKANQEAISMGKQRISIADALSSGDISAAAQAVQDLRAAQAASQSGAMQGAMDAARKNSIDNLTSGGLTKAQIEERQYQIQQQSFALTQQKKAIEAEIQKLQDLNYGLEQSIYDIKIQQLDPLNKALIAAQDTLKADQDRVAKEIEALEIEGKTVTEWENIKTKADLALDTFLAVETSSEAARDAAAALAKTYKDLDGSHITTYETHEITNIITTISGGTTDTSSNSSGSGGYAPGGNGSMRFAANGGLIQYFARGGKARGFDTVPAMLTPGEFVVKKSASLAYRPLLESMNSSTYPSMKNLGSSVSTNSNIMTSSTDNSQVAYNYNLSVNMNGTTADPNDVANAVLIKIRQLENQRVKGQAKY